jgi:hypothetical protein
LVVRTNHIIEQHAGEPSDHTWQYLQQALAVFFCKYHLAVWLHNHMRFVNHSIYDSMPGYIRHHYWQHDSYEHLHYRVYRHLGIFHDPDRHKVCPYTSLSDYSPNLHHDMYSGNYNIHNDLSSKQRYHYWQHHVDQLLHDCVYSHIGVFHNTDYHQARLHTECVHPSFRLHHGH